ncbi:MAG: hypothetical protein ACM3WS_04015 [Bacillota bacterium]
MAGLFDALTNADFLRGVAGGLRDAGNRAVAMSTGAPVDAITQALNLAIAGGGYVAHKTGLVDTPPSLIDTPVGGSEWIGQKMQDAGMVSAIRNPVAEFLSALVLPAAMKKVGPLVFHMEQAAARNATAVPAVRGPMAMQDGMIRTPFGRIPENGKDIDALANKLIDKAESLGYQISTDSSNVSGSRYITFKSPDDGPHYQIRISNHGDRYPNNLGTAEERFSVDPQSRNSYEEAVQWLKERGFNLSKRPKPASAPPAQVSPTSDVEYIHELVNGQWLRRPVKFIPVNGKMTAVYLDTP